MVEEKKQQIRKMTGDELTAGPNRTLEELEKMQWQQRKEMHVDSLTPDELKRILAEKEEARIRRERDARETEAAIKEREKKFLDELIADCLTGDPETRFAKFLVRASMKGIFGLNPMQDPRDKARVLTELLKFHNIQVRDGKEKPSRDDFERSVMFVSDPYIKKGDVVLTRRSMFPEVRPEQFDRTP